MGSGTYSVTDSRSRSVDLGYSTKSTAEVFTQRSINNAMSPYNLGIRESRDSEEHPNSLAIILALDVTGSMGSIPHHLIKEGLTDFMEEVVIKSGVKDAQVLFLGIGDHECDSSPLQVGQFESSDELLDKWLKDVYLEGGGGGNDGESYLLAWYTAAKHTSIDCFEKRGQKGFLVTIGDEQTLRKLPKSTLKNIIGDGQHEDYTAQALLDKAREKYHVIHIHVGETRAGSMKEIRDDWKQLMRDDCVIVERHQDIPDTIAKKIMSVLLEKTAEVTQSPAETREEEIL